MKTVAVIGAHNDRSRFGNKAVRAFLQQGFQVFPINPNETVIEGLEAYKTIAEVPVGHPWETAGTVPERPVSSSVST